MKNVEILLVDDDRTVREVLLQIIQDEGYSVTTASGVSEAISLLKEKKFPIVVSDIRLGDGNGLSIFSYIKEEQLDSLVIFVTGFANIDTAIEAIRGGAFDYLSKTLDLADMKEDLLLRIRRARQHWEATRRKPIQLGPGDMTSSLNIIGKSPSIVRVYRSIAKAANSRCNVLITGESGTGKELVARAIHANGIGRDKPFVTVNCCALTETLLESELFGHVKGSFTGALANKRGLFEEANGGTIFLDEIGDISPVVQVKLLRVLQEGEIKPVGASDNRKVDVRVITATHRDLASLVKKGSFRDDLFYRLKVFLISLPPLRERIEDLPDLVTYFLSKNSDHLQKPIESISEEAMTILKSHSWPGNIRELENAIEYAVTMSDSKTLFADDLPPEITLQAQAPSTAKMPRSGFVPRTLDEIERTEIQRTLEELNYNKSRAASMLGIDRVTLYRMAARYNISLKKRVS